MPSVSDLLVGLFFGGLLFASTLLGICGISWCIGELIFRIIPGIAPRVRKMCGWPEYRAKEIKMRARTTRRLPPHVPLPPKAKVEAIEARPTQPYSREFALVQAPRPISTSSVALLHPRACPMCKRPRRIFAIATDMCLRCDSEITGGSPERMPS